MPVRFSCEVCRYSRELPDDYSGRRVRCPQCDAAVEVTPSAPASDTRPCPFCAEPVKAEARKCRWCGEILDRDLARAKQQEKVREVERRREVLLKDAPGAKGSLILGIVGILVGPATVYLGFVLGPAALLMGLAALRALAKEPRLEGRTAARAGIVLGIVTLAATVLMILTGARLVDAG